MVQRVQLFTAGFGHVQVQALGLVQPFLPPGGGFHQPAGVDLERGGVAGFEFVGDAVDLLHGAVEVFEVVDHDVVPQAFGLEVTHQRGVHHGELAGQVRFHEQVLVCRLDGLGYADDVGNGRRGRNGHHVAVAHAITGDQLPHRGPVQAGGGVHHQVAVAAGVLQQVDGINGQNALLPQGAFVAFIGAAFTGQRGGGAQGEIAELLHGGIGKLHRLRAGVGQSQLVERILKAHQAEAHRAVLEVGVAGLGHRVVVDVDDIIEHAHGGGHGAFQTLHVQFAVVDMGGQVHRTQVAHGDFIGAGVEGDLGAEIGAVHHAFMLLGRAQVARILEGDPRMAGLEQHGEHLAPQLLGGNLFRQRDLALRHQRLVMLVAFAEGVAHQVVQVRHIAGGEQGPVAVFAHAFDQQVRHPVGGIHVVGAAALVAGVLAQLEEFLDVQVPAFQVGTHRALALAALVHRHGGVIDHFQERHHALAFAVGALDVGAQRTYWRPVVAQAAGPLGQHGVVADSAVDVFQIIAHGGEVAGRQLGMAGAAVKQRRCGRHVVERRQQVIELDGALVGVVLFQRQAHGHPHEEHLGQLQAGAVPVKEIAIVQGLQTEEAELQVLLRLDGRAQTLQIKARHGVVQQFVADAGFDKGTQGLGVDLRQRQAAGQLQRRGIFQSQLLQQQAGGDRAVVRFLFDAAAGGHHQRRQHVFLSDAVIEIAQRVFHQGFAVDAFQPRRGLLHLQFHQAQVQRHGVAVGLFYGQVRVRFHRRLAGALAGVFFPVQHVGAGHFLFFRPHQRQFHLVLDVFDVDLAAGFQAPADGLDHLLGDALNTIVNVGGASGLVALHGEEGLGDGHTDLGGVESNQGAVTFNDLKGFGLVWRCGLGLRGRLGFGQGRAGHVGSPEYAWFPCPSRRQRIG